jgi:acetyl-CoA C-acetyltransferase
VEEIVPVEVPTKKGSLTFAVDEHPRETSLDQLRRLPPVFKSDGGSVTAGNASGINDGAAAVVVASGEKVKELGLRPLARIRAVSAAAVPPSIMGIGPVPATKKALTKAGMTMADIDLIEVNEAFAAQALAVIRELGMDEDKVNVNGGAIALGHPVGCSGARIVVTLIYALQQRDKEIGLATLCVGGGQGATIIIERV